MVQLLNKRRRVAGNDPSIKSSDQIIQFFYKIFITNPILKAEIINLLSAFISFFPGCRIKLPQEMEQQIVIWDAKKIILDALDMRRIKEIALTGGIGELEEIILQLPDQGEKLILELINELKIIDQKEVSKKLGAIASIGQLKNVIALLSPTRVQLIVDQLYELLINNSDEYARKKAAYSLAQLSEIINRLPDVTASLIEKLHTILMDIKGSKKWLPAAQVLGSLSIPNTHQKIVEDITCFLSKMFRYRLENYRIPPRAVTSFALLGNQFISLLSDKGASLIHQLCALLIDSNVAPTTRTHAAQSLCRLSHSMAQMPDLFAYVVRTLEENLLHFCSIHGEECAYEIFAESMSCLIDVIDRSNPAGSAFLNALFIQMVKNDLYIELFDKCIPIINQLPDKGTSLVDRFINRLKASTVGKDSAKVTRSLSSIVAQLPDQRQELIAYFYQAFLNSSATLSLRACCAEALSYLGQSIALMPDKGRSIIRSLCEILRGTDDYWCDNTASKAIAASLGRLLHVLVELPDEFELVMKSLCDDSHAFVSNTILLIEAESIYQLRNLIPQLSDEGKAVFDYLIQIAGQSYYPSEMNVSAVGNLLCLLKGKIIKEDVFENTIGKFDSSYDRMDADHHDQVTQITFNIGSMLTQITRRLSSSYPEQMSWLCVLSRRLDQFSQHQNSLSYAGLARAMGKLYNEYSRQELILSKLPVKGVVRIVDEYAEEQETPQAKLA